MLTGPLEGEIIELDEETTLGRTTKADVYLADPSVSRWHASVHRSTDGRFVLTDLRSRNGTLVDGRRITTHALTPGDEFVIADSLFRFELAMVPAFRTAGTYQLQRVGVPTHIPTEITQRIVPLVDASREPTPDERLDEIVTFRHLQSRIKREATTTDSERARFATLLSRLRRPTHTKDGHLREYVRFECQHDARLRIGDGGAGAQLDVDVTDIGAGGARISAQEITVLENQLAWLAIARKDDDGGRRIVFTARVAWVDPETGQAGLVFSGAPSWNRRQRGSETDETGRTLGTSDSEDSEDEENTEPNQVPLDLERPKVTH